MKALLCVAIISGCVIVPRVERVAERRAQSYADRLSRINAAAIANAEEAAPGNQPANDQPPTTTSNRGGAEIVPVPRVQLVIETTDGDWCEACGRYKADAEIYRKAGWSVGTEPWNQIRFVDAASLEVKDRPLAVPRCRIRVDGDVRQSWLGYRKPDAVSAAVNEYRNRFSDAK